MSLQVGYIDSNGHPRIKIVVSGTNSGAVADVDAMIDTGFTGFLMLPVAQALPLGLVLYGTGNYTLADGSEVTNFLAKGTVTVTPPDGMPPPPPPFALQSETVEGIIVLAGDSVLVGMEFIRNLEKVLVVGPLVLLLDIGSIPQIPKAAPTAQPSEGGVSEPQSPMSATGGAAE